MVVEAVVGGLLVERVVERELVAGEGAGRADGPEDVLGALLGGQDSGGALAEVGGVAAPLLGDWLHVLGELARGPLVAAFDLAHYARTQLRRRPGALLPRLLRRRHLPHPRQLARQRRGLRVLLVLRLLRHLAHLVPHLERVCILPVLFDCVGLLCFVYVFELLYLRL